jgi:hypothetical protein
VFLKFKACQTLLAILRVNEEEDVDSKFLHLLVDFENHVPKSTMTGQESKSESNTNRLPEGNKDRWNWRLEILRER